MKTRMWLPICLTLMLLCSAVVLFTTQVGENTTCLMCEKKEAQGNQSRVNNEVIIWEKNTTGAIYTYGDNDDGIVYKKYYAGYSDGLGNFYIDELVLAQNQSLIIKPGITIHFTAKWGISVYGSIQAIGTESEPILFTSNSSEPKAWAWGQISIKDEFPGNAEFQFCRFEFGSGIDCQRDITVEDSQFYMNGALVLDSDKESSGGKSTGEYVIKNCTFEHETALGYIIGSSANSIEIRDTEFKNVSYVMRIYGVLDSCTISNNKFIDCGLIEILTENLKDSYFNDNFVNCTLTDLFGNIKASNNYITGILHVSSKYYEYKINHNTVLNGLVIERETGAPQTIDATYNYWGRVDHLEEVLPIDPEDSDYYPQLLYEPYLDEKGNVYVKPTNDDDDSYGVYIGIGIGAFLILLILVIVVIMVRRKRKPAAASKPAKTSAHPEPKPAQKQVDIECPNCSKRFKHKAGVTKVKCPHCRYEGNLE